MRSLGKHGVVSTELADLMARAAGFRNLLAHQYGTIDDGAVVRFLEQLEWLERYVQQVVTWLESARLSDSSD